MPYRGIGKWFRSKIAISEKVMDVSFRGKCLNGYLEWYFIVSHPHIIPPIHPVGDDGPTNNGGSLDHVSVSPPSVTN